jgi:hypothetical protein
MLVLLMVLQTAIGGCASGSRTSVALKEVFPGVRLDASTRTVEFDGVVPVDAHNPKFPRVYLEVVVSTPDTRPHEALVVTKAKAAEIHAALLLAGFKPGTPGSFAWEGQTLKASPPSGDPLRVWLVTRDASGRELVQAAESWVSVLPDNRPLEGNGWVFAGSRFRNRNGSEEYVGDIEGTIVGLTTFSSETIAWSTVYSPDSRIKEPEWIARPDRVPKINSVVTVRITPANPHAP